MQPNERQKKARVPRAHRGDPVRTPEERQAAVHLRNDALRKRYRRFCFTTNNWRDLEWNSFADWAKEYCTWAVCGREKGEEGTPHLQGACCLKTQMSLSKIKNFGLFSRSHIEQMFGTPADSLAYCTKEDKNAFVHGKMPTQGKRSDIAGVLADMSQGMSFRDMLADHGPAIVKYTRGLQFAKSLMDDPRDTSEPPTVYWLWGPTGSGKTKCAWEFARALYSDAVWASNDTLQWYDGYSGEPAAIMDDFRAKHVTFAFLLRLLDRYSLRVPIKGGFINWKPELIIITCPYSVARAFEKRGTHVPEDLEQLRRRITCEFYFGGEAYPGGPVYDGPMVYGPPISGARRFLGLLEQCESSSVGVPSVPGLVGRESSESSMSEDSLVAQMLLDMF